MLTEKNSKAKSIQYVLVWKDLVVQLEDHQGPTVWYRGKSVYYSDYFTPPYSESISKPYDPDRDRMFGLNIAGGESRLDATSKIASNAAYGCALCASGSFLKNDYAYLLFDSTQDSLGLVRWNMKELYLKAHEQESKFEEEVICHDGVVQFQVDDRNRVWVMTLNTIRHPNKKKGEIILGKIGVRLHCFAMGKKYLIVLSKSSQRKRAIGVLNRNSTEVGEGEGVNCRLRLYDMNMRLRSVAGYETTISRLTTASNMHMLRSKKIGEYLAITQIDLIVIVGININKLHVIHMHQLKPALSASMHSQACYRSASVFLISASKGIHKYTFKY